MNRNASRFLCAVFGVGALSPCVLHAADGDGGWEALAFEDGVRVFRKEVPGSDLVAFRGVTTIEAPATKVFSVLMDDARRTEWVDRLACSRILEAVGPYEYVIYQHFELPFFISDRDYVYRGKARRLADGRVELVMKSEEHPRAPPTVGVRAQLLRSRYLLTPLGERRTRVEVEIHTDPCGLLPAWLVNSIQESWPVKTLAGIRRQAHRPDVRPVRLPPLPRASSRGSGPTARGGGRPRRPAVSSLPAASPRR
ncbi:MAG: hypothetical protein D6731_24395 [Planctomycetota bacterium]|nr:MAG: hypothetical protein D6731_24395 [Planctomycetota bacterium]